MEPQFICEYMPTVKKLAEQTRSIRRPSVIFWAVVAVLVFLYILGNALLFQFQGMWIVLFLFGALYLIWGLALPEINAFLTIKRARKNIGKHPVRRISFCDSIEVAEATIRVIWEYNDINRVKRYKYTYVLLKNKHMGISLDPDGFTKGTFEEFKKFLRQKCPNIEIPE